MALICLRCSTPLGDEYQLVFDETGIELQLDKLLAEFFGISIETDETTKQALCTECVNKLIELYDAAEASREVPQSREETDYTATKEIQIINDLDVKQEDDELIFLEEQELDELEGEETNSYQSNEEFLGFEEDFEENLTKFAIVPAESGNQFEDINIQEYLRGVIKTELQEVAFEQNTVCRICCEILKSHTSVLMHVSQCHESASKKYPCIICDKVGEFDSVKDLSQHIVLQHYDLETINIYCLCPECGRRFSSFLQYNKHSCYKKTVGNRLLQECFLCAKEFSSNKRYRFHLQYHLEKRRPKACFICDILFSDENDFFEHVMYAHEKEDAFICKKCDRICSTRELYYNHMKLHSAVPSYHCTYCTKSYFYKQMLINHVQRHHSKKQTHLCKICKKSLASKHLLNRHMQLIHQEETEENVEVCSDCGLIGRSAQNALAHLEQNECPGAVINNEFLKLAYACEFCELAYNSVTNLKVHRLEHTTNSYKCWICESEYSEYKKLKTHVITHKTYDPLQTTFPVNRHYVCDFDSCEQSYLTWPSLRAHKARHTACAKYTCEICGQTFRTAMQLSTHLKAHDSNEEYSCQFCSKLCHSQMSLAVHIARKHNTNSKSCPTCKSTYNDDEALKEHIAAKHVNLECSYCGRACKSKRNLDIHIQMVHTKVKRFFCPICNKGYFNHGDLKVHERATHAEPKKFKCPTCDFSSSYEASFNAHLLKHEAKKPFKCGECSKEFTRKTCFKLHMLRHSDIKPFVCTAEDCDRRFVSRGVLNSHIRDSHPPKDDIRLPGAQAVKRKKIAPKAATTATRPKAKCVTPEAIKYVIVEAGSDSAAEMATEEGTEDGLVILEGANDGEEIVLEYAGDENDFIMDLSGAESINEYTIEQYD